jgi:hypothetical protein
MSEITAEAGITAYRVPEDVIRLDGPVARPAPGTLPLRGDLAHIALAGRYLAAHYVVPRPARTLGPVALREHAADDARTVTSYDGPRTLELLDREGDWAWVTEGPAGPSGYVRIEQLADCT